MFRLLNISADGFVIDTRWLFGYSEDEYLDSLDPLYEMARTGEEIRILSEADYQAILSLLPEGHNLPTQYDGIGNLQRVIRKAFEERDAFREEVQGHRLRQSYCQENNKDA